MRGIQKLPPQLCKPRENGKPQLRRDYPIYKTNSRVRPVGNLKKRQTLNKTKPSAKLVRSLRMAQKAFFENFVRYKQIFHQGKLQLLRLYHHR